MVAAEAPGTFLSTCLEEASVLPLVTVTRRLSFEPALSVRVEGLGRGLS